MDKASYERLLDAEKTPRIIKLSDLINHTPRTLLWGYTCDKESWHLFLKDGMFHLLVYKTTAPTPVEGDIVFRWDKTEINLDQASVVPNKRLYPDACDYEFCKLLKNAGVHLPFTTFDDKEREGDFHGYAGPVEKGKRVLRFELSLGDLNDCSFISPWYDDDQRCYAVSEWVRETFGLNRHAKDLNTPIFIRFVHGVDVEGIITESDARHFVVSRHTGVEEAAAAMVNIIAHAEAWVEEEKAGSLKPVLYATTG